MDLTGEGTRCERKSLEEDATTPAMSGRTVP
jgi:hypothetical protein